MTEDFWLSYSYTLRVKINILINFFLMIKNISVKATSIKKNFFFNLLLTLSNVVFPILTFPYVSRVLGPNGIGKVQFVSSFVQYFVFLAALGIPVYGIREVAKVRDNSDELKKIFSALLLLNIFTTILVSIAYFITIYFVTTLREDFIFYGVASTMLLLGFSSIDWFFLGIEKFKFIAFRSIGVKLLFIILLYVFVNEKTDVLPYLWIITGGTLVNNIWNLFLVFKFIDFKGISLDFLKMHLKPLFYIFATVLAASVYSSLDVILLGFLKGFKDVGYYSSGAKINRMCVPFLSALGVVLMPQIAKAFREQNNERIKLLIKESFEFVIILGVPMVFGLIILAPEIVILFSGHQFSPSIITMQITAPVVLIIGISTICSVLILTPASKDKQNAIAVVGGLIVSLISNCVLIPFYGYLGATISNVLAEFTVMSFFAFFAFKVIKFKFDIKLFLNSLFISLFFLPIVFLLRDYMNPNKIVLILFSVFLCGFWYVFFQIMVFKNQFLLKHVDTLRQKFKNLI